MVIEPIELLALKKLIVVCDALGSKLSSQARREQFALTSVFVDVCRRAEIENERAKVQDVSAQV